MTDPNNGSVPPVPPPGDPITPPPVTPSEPAAYAAPSDYPQPSGYDEPAAQPAYSQAAYATPGAVAPPKTLSLIGMIAGIVGLLAIGWFVPASIAALVLGYMGKKREGLPAKGFWLTAIITGWVGVAITIIGAIALIALIGLSATTGVGSY